MHRPLDEMAIGNQSSRGMPQHGVERAISLLRPTLNPVFGAQQRSQIHSVPKPPHHVGLINQLIGVIECPFPEFPPVVNHAGVVAEATGDSVCPWPAQSSATTL